MRYRIRHVTEYRYDEAVPLCHNVVHLRPRDTDRQSCLTTALTVSPEPAARRDRVDFFGNHVTWLSLQEPHERLRVEARSDVTVRPADPADPGPAPAWEAAVGHVRDGRDPASLDARQYTFDSPYVPRSAELADFARASFSPGRSLWDAARELNRRIYAEFRFDAGSTAVGTPVADVLRHRRGVCQDFAHLMVGSLRSIGVAARYVSGYLVTRPPAGQARLVGADASHAWAAVFFPGAGWVDFDPTNGCLPSAEHVTVGWARDYDDLAPVRGVIVGGHGHAMSVAVDVEPVGNEE